MLSEINALEWQEWKAYMDLSPSGEELNAIRAAHLEAAIWNVQIAKAQGAWDAAKSKRGARPEFRKMHEFIIKVGDMPDYKPAVATEPIGRGIFDMFDAHFKSLGFKPVKR